MSGWRRLGMVTTGNGMLAIVAPHFAATLGELWSERLRLENPAPDAVAAVRLRQRTVRYDLQDYDDEESCLLFHMPGNGGWYVEGRFEDVYGVGTCKLVELRIRLHDDDEDDEDE